MHELVVFDERVTTLGAVGLADFMDGFSFGCGLFETVRVEGGQPVFLERHLRRLRTSLAALADVVRSPAANLLTYDSVLAAVAAATREDARTAERTVLKVVAADGHRLLLFRDAPPDLAARLRGTSVEAVDRTTYRAGDPLRNHKTLAYLANYRGMQRRTLFVNEHDEVCETGSANLFFMTGGELVTPRLSAPCLPGVAREVVLEAGSVAGRRVVERATHLSELGEATAVVLTSALGVAPVTRLFGRELDGSLELAAHLRECVARAPDRS
ncbi:MAG TPA: aminotransferase class IV [Polyangiaceae bacterium]|nr:aminotransferase class IV [Polyangiaceae bacterium]